MIPVIIGAAALAAGVTGYALGKSDTPKKVVVNTVTKKAEVSEDYVKWQLDRAGKDCSQSGGSTQTNDDFESDFKRIDSMFAKGATNSAWNALESLERRARNLRNAKAMHKVADYYQRFSAYEKAFGCRDEANTFQTQTSSGGAFDSDFAKIEEMIADDLGDSFIGRNLDELRLRARSQRDAVAMRKIADYYDRIYAYHRASLSREEAKTF